MALGTTAFRNLVAQECQGLSLELQGMPATGPFEPMEAVDNFLEQLDDCQKTLSWAEHRELTGIGGHCRQECPCSSIPLTVYIYIHTYTHIDMSVKTVCVPFETHAYRIIQIRYQMKLQISYSCILRV